MLPAPLVDLLRQRLLTQNGLYIHAQARGHIRRVQQVAVQSTPRALDGHFLEKIPHRPSGLDGPLKERQAQKQIQAVLNLEQRIAALKKTAVGQAQTENAPHFAEAELQNIYNDLLAFPDSDASKEQTSIELTEEPPFDVVQILEERLSMFETTLWAQASATALSTKLQARVTDRLLSPDHGRIPEDRQTKTLSLETETPLRVLVERLRAVINSLQSIRPRINTDNSSSEASFVPLGLLSNTEWAALSRACLDVDDAPASEVVLELMKRIGSAPSDEQHDSVLNWYATRGLVSAADSYVSRISAEVPRERQRDLLVKARVKANRLDDACALMHALETTNTPAPMQSYTRVIQALLTQRGPGSELQKAQAWDMFSHMRYVAHATVDEFLYNVMIRACADPDDSEPERALDLFTEMTLDKGIAPTTHTYNAVILTCARSKGFALDAFRLAREMLNSHRDAHGVIPARLQPDNNTFCALLEAAKRMGDLSRARWILAQMSQSVRDVHEGQRPVHINEKVMKHVFHAYAAYRPPFRREAVTFASEEGPKVRQERAAQEVAPLQTQEVDSSKVRYSRTVPQSHQEVIKEASALWGRILEDTRAVKEAGDNPSVSQPLFSRVSLSTPLLNAYMTVHYAHSSPVASYSVYTDLFESLGVPRDAFTYVLALEAYAAGKRASDSELRIALSFVRDVWKQWRVLEEAGVSQLSDTPSSVDARLVERAWSAMMRILTLTGNLREASDLLQHFVERYPPDLVKKPSPLDAKRSTRTSLYAERPIVRLMDRSTVPEDRITPFLTFTDLGLLHQRAIAAKRPDLINYIKWVVKAYEGALRHRRDATMRVVT